MYASLNHTELMILSSVSGRYVFYRLEKKKSIWADLKIYFLDRER